MPVSIPRLRTWFAVLGLATAIVVAGFYFYARWQIHKAIREVPQKLGVEIQQSTEGFSLSKSEGGRTLFTIKASKAIQYKQGGRARLRDVTILVYGRKANRFDQIYGSGFEYDPQAGTITATGEVHIDLEANSEGPGNPDQQQPSELKNPIHLLTSGLVFNQKTGMAQTDQRIEFRVPQASGSALGASYDSKANLLTLKSNVKITTSGSRSTTIDAARGEITKDPREMLLERVRVDQQSRVVDAERVKVDFRADNSVEHMTATGDVHLQDSTPNGVSVRAPRADIEMGEKNLIRRSIFSGGVQIEGHGENNMNGTAGKVVVDFGGGNRLSHVRASESVHLVQGPSKVKKDSFALSTEAVDLKVKDGKQFEVAETSGPAQLELLQQSSAVGDKTVVSAAHFRADFDSRNHLRTLKGDPDARVVATTAGQPDKVATSRELLVQFAPGGGVSSIVQEGDFKYLEPQASSAAKGPGPGGRTATADRARYSPVDDSLSLTGSPRVTDGGFSLSARSVRINRRSGDAFAEGEVKTTYSELKQDPNGALLATADPIHVTSKSMNAQRQSGVARYMGGARLWQGANIVEAPTIEFDRQQKSIVAQGTRDKPVSSVFVQADKSGKTTPVLVTAAKLSYVDAQRQAKYTGGVTAKGADVTIMADQVNINLNPSGQRGPTVSGPAQLNEIVAEKNVVIQQTNRRATGDRLVYTAADGKFVLTGGPPMVADAEHGTIKGDSLTFYSHDDRIVVESNESSRTVTRTRVVR
jgi:lipopolysaccharide export system protein LptA